MKKKIAGIMILLTLVFLASASAETVVLKSGQRLENVKIVGKTEDSVKVYNYKIKEDGTDFGFVITYKADKIESIEPDKINRNHSISLSRIVFKSGKVVIASFDSDQDYIKIEVVEGVPVTYAWEDIDTIDGRKVDEIRKGKK